MMKSRFFLLGSLILVCGFSGCNLTNPIIPKQQILISSGYVHPDRITKQNVQIDTEAFEDVLSKAVSAKIFLGTDRIVDAVDLTEGTAQPSGTIFSYVTSNSCQDLPQGNNIGIRYEKYDAQGKVIQEDFAIVSI
jgi:hypothetical protein